MGSCISRVNSPSPVRQYAAWQVVVERCFTALPRRQLIQQHLIAPLPIPVTTIPSAPFIVNSKHNASLEDCSSYSWDYIDRPGCSVETEGSAPQRCCIVRDIQSGPHPNSTYINHNVISRINMAALFRKYCLATIRLIARTSQGLKLLKQNITKGDGGWVGRYTIICGFYLWLANSELWGWMFHGVWHQVIGKSLKRSERDLNNAR